MALAFEISIRLSMPIRFTCEHTQLACKRFFARCAVAPRTAPAHRAHTALYIGTAGDAQNTH
eukprot:2234934-Prymnesium_polylepis.1